MSQVLVCFDHETQTVDFAMDDRGFISLDGGLETASLYSTLTNRRAPESNTEVQAQPYGWWGDNYPEQDGDLWGSLLWLEFGRAKLTAEDARSVQVAVEEGHAWMLEDGLASTVDVTPALDGFDTISVAVNITQPDGTQWADVWQVHRNAVRGTV